MNINVLLLLLVTLVWGTTFPLMKAASATLSGVEISALRFLVAGLVMLPFAMKASRAAWRDGAVLGVVALVSYVTQAVGVEYISSNRSAFITSLNVLMVPFLGLALGGRLNAQILGAAALACLGIGLLSWEGGGNWIGDGITLLCALSYAIYVILLSRRAPAHHPRTLAATQIVLMAAFALVWMLASGLSGDRLATLPARLETTWLPILYLGLVASAGMLFLQAVAQRHVSAEKAAVIYAMEPVFAALFGWLWLAEMLGGRGMLGGALVVIAVVLSEWKFNQAERAPAT
ncbi:DMT family transporter [Niveibacterium sp. 24ML]|uniref:DMT family transporter n=1 Tax=Niveibacterium sp. 24ML TaxID=2985512 RepID=UPI00226FF802|nr:DMT family transporter [Niveibacterium sp. 24ML]MCX9155621.1 DMT family transporter [Niveibacterium sp. 24ML]